MNDHANLSLYPLYSSFGPINYVIQNNSHTPPNSKGINTMNAWIHRRYIFFPRPKEHHVFFLAVLCSSCSSLVFTHLVFCPQEFLYCRYFQPAFHCISNQKSRVPFFPPLRQKNVCELLISGQIFDQASQTAETRVDKKNTGGVLKQKTRVKKWFNNSIFFSARTGQHRKNFPSITAPLPHPTPSRQNIF